MAGAFEGPDPPLPVWLGHTLSWTGGDVLLWMKQFFSTDPRTRSASEARPIAWPNDYLSPADPDWSKKGDILLSWARCRAERTSFQEVIRRHPRTWGSPATVYRLRDDAAAEIANGINAKIENSMPDSKRTDGFCSVDHRNSKS